MPAFVPGAARTMHLFEVFAQARREMSNAEIAKLLGVPESSSLDLLHTLQQGGYLIRTARSRRFYPTARLFSLASSIAANDPLAAVSAEAIDLLREETGETTISGVLEGHHVEVTAVREGSHELRYMVPVGRRMALHVSAAGKALLAAIEPDEVRLLLGEKPLRAVTPHSVTDPQQLMAQVRAIRRQGLAEAADEGSEGVGAMAVAGRVGDQLLAFSIFGPTERLKRHRAAYRRSLLKAKELAFGAEHAETDVAA